VKGETIAWTGKKTVVLGMGRSGQAAAEWLLAQKAEVTVFDEGKSAVLKDLARRWEARGARAVTGTDRLPDTRFDHAILSPGIDPKRPVVVQLRTAKVPMFGELELGARACLCPIVAITGTNGKSTTTELVTAAFQAAGKKAVACGNLGQPLCEAAPLSGGLDYAVAEVSSFQLETIETFHPRIAVYLNLTPDHLDRYADMREYGAAKNRMFENQTSGDVAVVQKGLALPKLMARTVTFSAADPGADYTLREGWLCAGNDRVMRQEETKLYGPHNAENLLAALAVADAEKISREAVKKAFAAYRPLPHRCEVVAVRGGVTWINDSKATNLDAMERAVLGMAGPVILIAGGKDKGFDFAPSLPHLQGRVRAALLIGETAAKIEKAWRDGVPCRRVGTLEEAVKKAAALAHPGETVLLSPGCSSYDQFKNFEERGETYRQCVKALPQEENQQP
jgi:UDP-N-acetylmuramoylalanine--D-glutamate ligase